MSAIEEFVEEYNALVIDGEKTAFFQVVHAGTEEVWHTFPNPADPQKIQSSISNIGIELPTGRHSIRVQAISESSKAIRGQIAQSIEGRSAAAKSSMNDAINMAKATQMNIQTADTQLVNMSARLQAADERAREAEGRAGDMISEVYKMGDMVNKFIMERESSVVDREERDSRNKSFMMIAETMAPIVGQAVQVGSMFMEMWIKDKQEEMKAASDKKRKAREAADETPPNIHTSVNSESAN
jgi:hypothetical protein